MKKKILTRATLVFTLPLILAAMPAYADSFVGYAVEVLSGASGTNPSFDTALIGLSSTPTGAVALYRFTSDRTYASMLSDIRLHQQKVSVSYVGGTVTGVYLNRP